MASRCISTLNDLDKISDRIYYNHSKGRFRAGIEAKLKASREKAERSLRDIDKESPCSYKTAPSYRSSVRTSSSTVSSSYFSTSASNTSRAVASDHPDKGGQDKALKNSTTKSVTNGQRDKIQRRKTKSCPSSTLSSKTSSSDEKSAGDKTVKTDVPRTASMFGKYNGKDSEYKPTAWFNLPQETSVGVINSFECGVKNTTPLCYSINAKKGESVPNLLRHNLEVRVGRNGVVRTEKNREKVPGLSDENAKQGKKRTAPLNWEEQLNWQNACVLSAGLQTDDDSSSKGLCETHPVIFHERKPERGKDSKLNEEKIHSPAYKLSLETRWVYPDRRNWVSTRDKCITAVEIEDARSEDAVSADSKLASQHGYNVTANAHAPNVEEKVLKRVSFEDGESSSEKVVGIIKAERSENKEVTKFNELMPVTDESKKIGCGSVWKIRPKTSRERTRTNKEETMSDVRKLRRPQTAPPCPPSTPRLQVESRFSNCVPIKIPTSEADMESNSFANTPENQTSEEKLTFVERSVSVPPEESDESLVENEEFPAFSIEISAASTRDKIAFQDGCPPKRVSFENSPRSAPVSRTATPHQEGKLPQRANSFTAFQRRPYKSPSPVVIVSDSSLELPKDLPPAQALVALRKKIREELAQQNHDLQLDIQQLYLRKHTE